MPKKPAIGFIFVTLLVDTIGFGIIIPVMPNLISELAHVTISEALARLQNLVDICYLLLR